MATPRSYHFSLPAYQGSALPEPPFSWYPGVHRHHPHCTSDRTLHGDGAIRTFVIHATAGSSAASAMSVLFNHAASWHWLIPSEAEPEHGIKVWACAPERRAAWHVRNDCFHPDVNNGSRFTNYSSLGVEIVNTQRNDPFSEWQLQQTAALVRYAWSKYPTLVDVVSHAKLDPTRRSDPGTDFDWERFRAMVLEPQKVGAERLAVRAASMPISVVGPNGQSIQCEARSVDGVMMVEARALIEALGFSADFASSFEAGSEFDDSSATRIIISGGPAARLSVSKRHSEPATPRKKGRLKSRSRRRRSK